MSYEFNAFKHLSREQLLNYIALQREQAEFPEDVKAPVQYGERVLAHAVYLNTYHLIPLKRVREWFADCVGQAVSEATIEKVVNLLADKVSPALDVIYEGLTRS